MIKYVDIPDGLTFELCTDDYGEGYANEYLVLEVFDIGGRSKKYKICNSKAKQLIDLLELYVKESEG
jgi:hypothetical protein